jgi:hypothetical protein
MHQRDVLLATPALHGLLTKVSHPECKKQLFTFANQVRKAALAAGVDEGVIDGAIRAALAQAGETCTALNGECMLLIQETVENFLNSDDRGRDVLGRLLARYCFHRADGAPWVRELGSAEDEAARDAFVPGVLPRPLADHFLIMVRGSVDGLDPIRSLPLLFGTDLEYLEELRARAEEVLADYRIGDEAEDSPVYWEGMFQDNRTQRIALDLLAEVLARMEASGADHVLRILANLEGKYKRAHGHTPMRRAFTAGDVEQLMAVLARGREELESLQQRCALPRTRAQALAGQAPEQG